jgi:hypothetical protein
LRDNHLDRGLLGLGKVARHSFFDEKTIEAAIISFSHRSLHADLVVMPPKIRWVIPLPSRMVCKAVAWKAPLPGLSITTSPAKGANAEIISLLGSPRTRIRPIGPGSRIRIAGRLRRRLKGGQSDRSGACDSRVCAIVMPIPRAQASNLAAGSKTSRARIHDFGRLHAKARASRMPTSARCGFGAPGAVATTPDGGLLLTVADGGKWSG